MILFLPMQLHFRRFILGALCLAILFACGESTDTRNLGQPCDSERSCRTGQACLVARAPSDTAPASLISLGSPYILADRGDDEAGEEPSEEIATCQIPCRSSTDCPDDYVCRQVNPDDETDETAICVPDA